MRDYLQFLLAPLFLEVILVTKEVSKKVFERFNFGGLPPKKTQFWPRLPKIGCLSQEKVIYSAVS